MGRPLAHVDMRSAFGPLLPLPGVHSLAASARRGRRCPVEAHAVAVGALRRLHCDARPGVASQDSLRSLRSLRSNSCDESVHEARCARQPQACAFRRHRNRPRRAPPAALQRLWFLSRTAPAPQQRRVRAGRAAPLGCREGEPGASGPGDRLRLANGRADWPGAACKARARGLARSANRQLTRRGCPNAVSEVSSATGPRGRASQGSLSEAKTAPVKRSGLPGRAFAAPGLARRADIQGQQRAESSPTSHRLAWYQPTSACEAIASLFGPRAE